MTQILPATRKRIMIVVKSCVVFRRGMDNNDRKLWAATCASLTGAMGSLVIAAADCGDRRGHPDRPPADAAEPDDLVVLDVAVRVRDRDLGADATTRPAFV